MQSDKMSDEEWATWSPINLVFNILKNILFCVAISMNKKGVVDSLFEKAETDFFEKPLNRK
jgi:hypothetical protein